MVSGFLGSSSLFIAVFPSFVVVPLLASPQLGLSPLLVGILAGIGAGVGQYLHYYVGLGGRYLLSESRRESLDKWSRRLERWGVILVFLFAATPLSPDDVLWIPLGMMEYPKFKALLTAVAGKIVLNLGYAYAGFYGWSFFLDLLQLVI